MWIAKRNLKVGTDTRAIGDPVPEAESWIRRESWERFGFIEWKDAPPPKAKTKKATVQRRA